MNKKILELICMKQLDPVVSVAINRKVDSVEFGKYLSVEP